MNTDFRPPKTSPAVVWLTYLVFPLIPRLARKVVGVDVDEQDWARLASLRDHRFILTPNHPSSNDPLIALWIGRRLGRSFNYLACRELFAGAYGLLLQRLGCYSILRGALDREAVRTTVSLLAEQDRQLVIFPEGEIYGHNDMLLPFQSGVVQMGFMALERLQKAGREPGLPVVPAAVKYLHVVEARPAIREGLERLELALGVHRDPERDDYLRLRRVGERVLARVEQEYRLQGGDRPPAERVEEVKAAILKRVADSLGVPPPGGRFAEGLHALLGEVHEFAEEFADAGTDYDQRLHRKRHVAAVPLYQDLWRLQNMLAVTDGYVAAHMTTERFVEVMNRLEVEVFGGQRTRIPSRARLRIAEPVELGEHLDAYREKKRVAVTETTAALERRMRELLEELLQLGTLLER